MVSFQRMRDDLDELSTHVSNKLPVSNRVSCLVLLAGLLLVVLLVALVVVVISGGGGGDGGGDSSSELQVSDTSSSSCPALDAERLLSKVASDTSFQGLVVDMACEGDYTPFPNQVKCRKDGEGKLEWSHLPVCHPTLLISSKHWKQTYHARSVSCTGNSTLTQCSLACVSDYVAVERRPYVCTERPCASWQLQGNESKCFMCDEKCEQLHAVDDPEADKLLGAIGCEQECTNMLVLADGEAAVWQSKRIGLFGFVGEHNGRPVFQNMASKEYLFFTWTGSEWLVGPDFRKPHAGIQIFGNDHKFCPEMSGGPNATKLFINPSAELDNDDPMGMWSTDNTLRLECMSQTYQPVQCPCNKYKVYTLVYSGNQTRPEAADLLTGNNFVKKMNDDSKNDDDEDDEDDDDVNKSNGLLAPVYLDKEKQIMLFSHHPQGRVWQVSQKLTTTPLRSVLRPDSQKTSACPDDPDLEWEWFHSADLEGKQTYVKDDHVHVKCLDGHAFEG